MLVSRWQTTGCKYRLHHLPLPVWAVLVSMLIHGVGITLVWCFVSPPWVETRQLHITFRSTRHTDVTWTTYGFHARDSEYQKAWQPRKTKSTNYSDGPTPENPATAVDQDEVYLPQEVLTTAATPNEEIDLQGESPPGPGGFLITLWISKDGLVTQVDLKDSETPIWFTDRIIEIFKQSRFVPGMREDRPVASTLLVEITF